MLIGEYTRTLENNRITFPTKLRKHIGNEAVITRGFDCSIFLFTLKQWEHISDKINLLSLSKKQNRDFTRFFFSGASNIKFDKQGRFIIPNYLLEYAKINNQCILVGLENRMEIWSQNLWNEILKNSFDKFSGIGEEILDFDINI